MIGSVTKAGHGHVVTVGYNAEDMLYVANVITAKATTQVSDADLMALRKEVDGMVSAEASSLVVNAFRNFSQNLRGQCRAVMQQTRLYIQASRGKGRKKVVKPAAKKMVKKVRRSAE